MIDQNYNNILEEVLKNGSWYDDPNRKDVKRLEIPSYTFRHEFKDGFPAISTKKLAWKSVVTELLWFLKGDTNIKYLLDNGCNIWNKDAYNYYCKHFLEKNPDFKQNLFTIEEFVSIIKRDSFKVLNNPQNIGKHYTLGDLGKVYGHYWRNFDGIDQISELINDMINKPMSSELIVSARNPSHKGVQALPCCHYGFQVIMRPLGWVRRLEEYKNSTNNDHLDYIPLDQKGIDFINEELENKGIPKYGFELHWQQRSCDLFLGKIWELLK